MRILSYICLLLFFVFSAFVIGPIVLKGYSALDWQYLTTEPSFMGRQGGIGPILLASVWINFISLFFTVFIGMGTALYISSAKRHMRKYILKILNSFLDVLAGTPSIVFGLFGHAFFCIYLKLGYSILAGALTLSLMSLPMFIRLIEDSIAMLPEEYYLTAQSLDIGQLNFVFKVLLPSIFPSLVAAVILSWTKAIGETAALLFTSGYAMRWPETSMDSARSLSVHIFDLSLNITGADGMAYRAAFALLCMSVLFVAISRTLIKAAIRWKI